MQQDSLAIPPWILESLKWLAGIGAGGLIVRFVTLYQNRHRPVAELHKTDAETTEITVRTSSNAGDAMMRMMDRLDVAQQNIDRLRIERDSWRVEALNAKDDAKTAQMFVDQLNAAARLTVCEHHPAGVKLSDYTPQQLNKSKHD